ncbi:MAG TPA: gamma-glutamyltransferase [Polyangiaceae bacterium]|jgi:gamma-glutamyltranspeptidase/glutathione hydrolase|nr:gamma-glutamyltransferase [Polyangiaceae bacterium]
MPQVTETKLGQSRQFRALAATRLASPGFAALCALGLTLGAPGGHAQAQRARVAVATENAIATREGLAELAAGGNAVDAIVRAALVSGVVSPSSSGLGGGGFALLWRATSHEPIVLDFRETAPAAIDAAAFEARPFKPEERARASGVPGELAGLFELQHSFGKRRWQDVVSPAAHIAQSGFAVSPHLGSILLSPFAKLAASDPGIAAVFFPAGQAVATGKSAKNPTLGRTLTRIAAQGKTPFYDGDIAADLILAAHAAGGALAASDLRDYRPQRRVPIHLSWEGYDIYTMPLPSAGGVVVGETLGTFSKTELEKLPLNSGVYQHLLAEAMRGALSDRLRFLGDPDFEKIDVLALLDPKRIADRKRRISSERTHALPRFEEDEHGTHHLLVVDAEGNVASLTTTVNNAFGAKISGKASGVVLNDELDDFTRQKDVAAFGLSQSPNRPRPGARPLSSMTPTLVVKDGKVVFALGGSGGQLIATNVTQLLLARLVFGLTPKELVTLPRFAVPLSGPSLLVEAGAPRSLIDDLSWRGEVVQEMKENPSAVQVVAIDDSGVTAAADPRKQGSALVK